MIDYEEFLDGIDRKAYHEGEVEWEEDGCTVTRTYNYSARRLPRLLRCPAVYRQGRQARRRWRVIRIRPVCERDSCACAAWTWTRW